ncbi:MAG: Hsp20/alpha crystallin family protein [Anaerolineales bacterium]
MRLDVVVDGLDQFENAVEDPSADAFVSDLAEEAENFLRRERPSGRFYRSLRFAAKLEAEKAEAKLENGILTLRIPKVAEAQPKSIKVKTK